MPRTLDGIKKKWKYKKVSGIVFCKCIFDERYISWKFHQSGDIYRSIIAICSITPFSIFLFRWYLFSLSFFSLFFFYYAKAFIHFSVDYTFDCYEYALKCIEIGLLEINWKIIFRILKNLEILEYISHEFLSKISQNQINNF